jgi:hypothetical protein
MPSERVSGASRVGRSGAAILVVIGLSLLVASTFAAVVRVRVGALSGVGFDASGWDRHGPAMPLLAAAGAVLAAGAVRGVRAAAVGVAAVGLTALLVAVVGDAGDLHRTGGAALAYEDVTAGPGPGWYFETAGAVALVVAGAALAVLAGAPRAVGERTVAERA